MAEPHCLRSPDTHGCYHIGHHPHHQTGNILMHLVEVTHKHTGVTTVPVHAYSTQTEGGGGWSRPRCDLAPQISVENGGGWPCRRGRLGFGGIWGCNQVRIASRPAAPATPRLSSSTVHMRSVRQQRLPPPCRCAPLHSVLTTQFCWGMDSAGGVWEGGWGVGSGAVKEGPKGGRRGGGGGRSRKPSETNKRETASGVGCTHRASQGHPTAAKR